MTAFNEKHVLPPGESAADRGMTTMRTPHVSQSAYLMRDGETVPGIGIWTNTSSRRVDAG